MRALLTLALLFTLFSCGGDEPGLRGNVVAKDGECAALLELQCDCCGSGRDYCLQFVEETVASGEARTDSTEAECAARRERVGTDVPKWCTETFVTVEQKRAACQGFAP